MQLGLQKDVQQIILFCWPNVNSMLLSSFYFFLDFLFFFFSACDKSVISSSSSTDLLFDSLTVRQRAKCQLVCSSWKDIVLEKGIAVVVDINDVGLFPKTKCSDPPTTANSSNFTTSPIFMNITKSIHSSLSNRISSTTQNTYDHQSSRSLLRGLLNHSYSSLEALVLNDFISLKPELDLHPALPFLRKLQRLDISRIPTITDETLRLISTFIGQRLEVLYIVYEGSKYGHERWYGPPCPIVLQFACIGCLTSASTWRFGRDCHRTILDKIGINPSLFPS